MKALSMAAEGFSRLGGVVIKQVKTLLFMTFIFSWDFGLTILNIVLPRKRIGGVIAQGVPGYKGIWPEYKPPVEGDSRSPCPALNALANHGILPRNGRNIKWKEISRVVRAVYNLSPTMVLQVPIASAGLFERNYFTDSMNLGDLNAHNVIEHDASLTRHDTAFQPDQGKPAIDLIRELLKLGTVPSGSAGKSGPVITPSAIAAFSTARRAHSRANNSQYTLGGFHKFFSASNSSIMYDTFAGNVNDLTIWLEEERLPDGWEPKVRRHFGYTVFDLHRRLAEIELQTRNPPADSKKH